MKIKNALLLSFLLLFVSHVSGKSIEDRLKAITGISDVEKLESDHYAEKYLVRFIQPVDHNDPAAGSFLQRIIVAHVGYDRPTIMVTEGYGAAYALRRGYQEELSRLLNANMIFVEHRYFLESTPEPCNWDYLTAENSAYDLHRVNRLFKDMYKEKWGSTGISKGGQTTCLYRAYFPDDVDFSVPYVAPLNFAKEDGRHEQFLKEVGSEQERNRIECYQTELFKRKGEMVDLLSAYCNENNLEHRISMAQLFDYCVLEYSFALWQWGADRTQIPAVESSSKELFAHLMKISGPEYFAENQLNTSFFVQAARELGYYGYDTKPFKKYLSINSTEGYLDNILLPQELVGKVEYRPALAQKVYRYLKDHDPRIIFIYGEVDPWTASRVPTFEGKTNEFIYIQPNGSHGARISTMPKAMREEIMMTLNRWLNE